MKPNSQNTTQSGFTLIELIVVIALLGLMATLMTVNFNQQRARRSVVLAQNETITNARKVQSYLLSGRNISENTPALYYTVTFYADKNEAGFNSDQYLIAAIDKDYNLFNVETVKLPEGVTVSGIEVDIVDEEKGEEGAGTSTECITVAFAAPFGQMYIHDSTCEDQFLQILRNPVTRYQIANRDARITLSNYRSDLTKQLVFFGLSGRIDPR